MVFNATFSQQYFNFIVAVSFIGGENQSTLGKCKPPAASLHWQSLSQNVASSTPDHEHDSNSQHIAT